jgi:hypothetical protein
MTGRDALWLVNGNLLGLGFPMEEAASVGKELLEPRSARHIPVYA